MTNSTAVMTKRDEPLDSFDFYPTPPWAIRVLFEMYLAGIIVINIFEPGAGQGDMTRVLEEYATGHVIPSDIHDYGKGHSVVDYLSDEYRGSNQPCDDWVITNPPFKLALEFALKAVKQISGPGKSGKGGVAMFVRLQWLEGQKRYADIFKPYPPSHIIIFTERVPMAKGKLDPKAHSAVAYAWVIWRPGVNENTITTVSWTGVCKNDFTRPGDYPDDNTVIVFGSEFMDIEEMIK